MEYLDDETNHEAAEKLADLEERYADLSTDLSFLCETLVNAITGEMEMSEQNSDGLAGLLHDLEDRADVFREDLADLSNLETKVN